MSASATTLDVVPVPRGDYLIGSGESVSTAGFAIGRMPVMNREFACYAADASTTWPRHTAAWSTPAFAEYPVVDITWSQARSYCEWLSVRSGARVRLPTSAEWEVAARGSAALLYPWGEHFEPNRCLSLDGGAMSATAVGSFPEGAAPCGALDMVGLVWQWCDEFVDGEVPIKGGCWLDSAWGLRANRTLWTDPERPTHTTGLRILIETESE